MNKNYNLINKNAFHLELKVVEYECRTFWPKTLNFDLFNLEPWSLGLKNRGLKFGVEKSGVKMSCNSEMVYIFKEEIPITNELNIFKNTYLSIWYVFKYVYCVQKVSVNWRTEIRVTKTFGFLLVMQSNRRWLKVFWVSESCNINKSCWGKIGDFMLR